MAVRTVNGSTFTEDGWPLVDQAGCTWITVAGSNPPVSLQIQSGVPATVMGAWAADWNAFIEPLRDADSASWTEGNSVLGGYGRNNGSNHLGGTAEDLNWESHPFRKRGSLNAAQMATLKEMEDFYEGTMFWAGRWDDPADEMHSQMGYDTYDRAAGDAYPWVKDFIARKIRADGFSTFRRGTAPPVASGAAVLSQATGLSPARAGEILATMGDGLRQAECTNPNRIAMFIAQTGTESAGFNATEEYASGSEYEGRADLGNTQRGDGVRFKGRTWIQITGRAHYAEFSAWAHAHGLVPTETYFVDNPGELGDLKWAGIGAAWYWTVSRPDINTLSDQGDVYTVTRRINGGTNGLTDRQTRYSRAMTLGDQLLTLVNPTTNDPLEELIMSNPAAPSASIYATPGEPPVPVIEMIRSLDAHGPHEPYVEQKAREGDDDALSRVIRTAAGQGQYGNASGPVNQAKAVLAQIEAATPDVLKQYLATKGA